MGSASYAKHEASRTIFERATAFLGYDIADLCFSGPIDKLTDTEFQQPALFTVGMAHWAAILHAPYHVSTPPYLAGQSLGEITALTAAGYFLFENGLHLAQQRGRLMKQSAETTKGGMTAILGLEAEVTAQICAEVQTETGQILQLANDNSPVQQIISGELDALESAETRLKQAGAKKTVRLAISIASHCDLMQDVAAEFSNVLAKVAVRKGNLAVVSNVSAEILPTNNPDAIRNELITQLTAPVRWRESMLTLRALGVDTFIEVGPGDVLTKLMKRIDRTTKREVWQP